MFAKPVRLIVLSSLVLVRVIDVIASPPSTRNILKSFELEGVVSDGDRRYAFPKHSTFSRNSKYFVRDNGRSVRVWDAQTLKPITDWLIEPDIKDYGITSNGTVVFAFNSTECRLWDIATAKLRTVISSFDPPIAAVDVGSEGDRVVIVDGRLAIWRVGQAKPDFLIPRVFCSAEFDPTGSLLAVRDYGKGFYIYSASTGRPLNQLIPWETDFLGNRAGSFDGSGQFLAPSRTGFRIVGAQTGKVVVEGQVESGVDTSDPHFACGEKSVVFTTLLPVYGEIFICSALTGQIERRFGKGYNRCQVTPDARWAICSEDEGHDEITCSILYLEPDRVVQSLRVEHLSDADLSPDGKTLLLTKKRGPTEVWRLKDVGLDENRR